MAKEELSTVGQGKVNRRYVLVVNALIVGAVFMGRYMYKESHSSDTDVMDQRMQVLHMAIRQEIEQLRAYNNQGTGLPKEDENATIESLRKELSALRNELRSLQAQQTQLSTKLLQAGGRADQQPGTTIRENPVVNTSFIGSENVQKVDTSQSQIEGSSGILNENAVSSGGSNGLGQPLLHSARANGSITTVLPHGTSDPTNAQNSQRVGFETPRPTIYSATTNGAYTHQGPQTDTGFPFPYGATTNTNTASQNTLTSQGGSTVSPSSYQGMVNSNYGSSSSNGNHVLQHTTTTNQNIHRNSGLRTYTVSSSAK